MVFGATKSRDQKGDKNPFYGKKHSEETRQKMKLSWRNVPRMLGKFHTEEWKRKLSKSLMGNKRSLGRKLSDETKKKIGEKLSKIQQGSNNSMFGKHHSIKHRIEMSKLLKGDKGAGWKGGITSKNERIRKGIEYRLWRESVFARDNWICLKCKVKGGRIIAHHILNFAQYPELRFAIDNGVTFCRECHKEFHKKYGFSKNNKEQINQF